MQRGFGFQGFGFNRVAPGINSVVPHANLLRQLLPLLSGKVSPIFDPSDISSMWQTSTGVTAVAASSDPVGLHLDSQYFGGLPASAYIASQTEARASGAIGLTGSATAATYNTGTGAGTATRGADINNQSYVQWTSLVAAARYYIDIENTASNSLTVRSGTHTGATTTQAVTTGQRLTILLPPTSTTITITATSNSQTASFTVHSFKAVPGYHRIQATGTKRPFYTEAEGLKFLLYDGIDDCLQTPSIDYTGGDQMTALSGMRLLATETDGSIIESSAVWASNNGAFVLSIAQLSGVPDKAVAGSRGTAAVSAAESAGTTPPVSAVLTLNADISTPVVTVRRNGAQAATSATSQGTGNYGNYAINYGSRNNGASAPINMREYWSLVTPQVDAQVTSLAERIAAQKSGVSL